jgi:hypothetical protein
LLIHQKTKVENDLIISERKKMSCMSLKNVYMKSFWGHMLIRIVCVLISMALVVSIAGAAEGPAISIWYGSNQAVGELGEPQRWINILGNVSDPNGVASLSYTLNGGQASVLSMGPDHRRLGELGDFNVEIGYWELSDGPNEVTITAVDSLDNQSIKIVTVNYTKGNTWPLNYSIDWGIAGSINDVAQIVDGKWRIESGKVRTVEPGYDRLIAIGDRSWTNYEVTVPVIVHSIVDDYIYTPIVGILTRWQGHVANGSQPSDQWWPLGALASYSFGASPSFAMWLTPEDVRVANSSFVFELGTEYIFKLRSETIGNDSLYKFKIWKSSEQEPLGWDQIEEELNDDQTTGSILLLAHEVDASFGNVTITSFFIDVPPNHWAYDYIMAIYKAGITTGCSQDPLKYCPLREVNRAQMAVFLERCINGGDYTPPPAIGIFDDVPATFWAADWIEQLYEDGITTGCAKSPLRYCPDRAVSRAAMAVFLLRAKHGSNYNPPAATGVFDDVPVTYWAADWIEQLYREGITTGCSKNPLNYCPLKAVSRAQMAVFLARVCLNME